MKRFLVGVAVCIMATSGAMALPSANGFQVVSSEKASSIWGGGCVGVGAQITWCCHCYCATWGSNTNSGNAVNGPGSSGSSSLPCPCDASNTHQVAAGSCQQGA